MLMCYIGPTIHVDGVSEYTTHVTVYLSDTHMIQMYLHSITSALSYYDQYLRVSVSVVSSICVYASAS